VLRLRDPFESADVTWNRLNVGRVGADWTVMMSAGDELVGTVAAGR